MAETPEDLYLKTMTIQKVQELDEQKKLVHQYFTDIRGIIYGDNAEQRVVNYKNMLETSTALGDFVGTLSVAQFDENLATEDDLDDIVFTIVIESVKKVEK